MNYDGLFLFSNLFLSRRYLKGCMKKYRKNLINCELTMMVLFQFSVYFWVTCMYNNLQRKKSCKNFINCELWLFFLLCLVLGKNWQHICSSLLSFMSYTAKYQFYVLAYYFYFFFFLKIPFLFYVLLLFNFWPFHSPEFFRYLKISTNFESCWKIYPWT